MIVIEGIDGSGKSTLACMLSEVFIEYTLRKSLGVPINRIDALKRVMHELDSRNHNMILDRSQCISQWVYGSLNMKGKNEVGVSGNIIEFFTNKKPFFIYCTPPTEEEFVNRMKLKHPAMLANVMCDNYHYIESKYYRLTKMFKPGFIWDWRNSTIDDFERLVSAISQQVKDQIQ